MNCLESFEDRIVLYRGPIWAVCLFNLEIKWLKSFLINNLILQEVTTVVLERNPGF